MQTTSLPPYFWCSFTRLGNSFMQGGQLVDQASRTTTLPLFAATSLSVSSQSTILRETFDLADSALDESLAVFSSAAIPRTSATPNRHKQTVEKSIFAGFIRTGLRQIVRMIRRREMN